MFVYKMKLLPSPPFTAGLWPVKGQVCIKHYTFAVLQEIFVHLFSTNYKKHYNIFVFLMFVSLNFIKLCALSMAPGGQVGEAPVVSYLVRRVIGQSGSDTN